jgi:hypothetical protein
MIEEDFSEDLPGQQPAPDTSLADLLALLADEKQYAAHMLGLDRRLTAATKGAAKLAADRIAFDEYEKTARADLVDENAALTKRKGTAYASDVALRTRWARIAKLEKTWRTSGESDPDVQSGFREPSSPYTALERARRAYGHKVPPRDHDIPPDPLYLHASAQRSPRATVRR